MPPKLNSKDADNNYSESEQSVDFERQSATGHQSREKIGTEKNLLAGVGTNNTQVRNTLGSDRQHKKSQLLESREHFLQEKAVQMSLADQMKSSHTNNLSDMFT